MFIGPITLVLKVVCMASGLVVCRVSWARNPALLTSRLRPPVPTREPTCWADCLMVERSVASDRKRMKVLTLVVLRMGMRMGQKHRGKVHSREVVPKRMTVMFGCFFASSFKACNAERRRSSFREMITRYLWRGSDSHRGA